MEPFITAFLRESNLIEGVEDADSLQQAIYAWEYLISEKELTHGVILKTHKILMNHQKIRPDERGYYRQRDVMITKREIIGIDPDTEKLIVKDTKIRDCLDHKKIRGEMTSWIEKINLHSNSKHSKKQNEQDIKMFHVQFENIHPFIDGNGRVGRMLLNWHRLKIGLSLMIILNKDKKEYYEWFKQ